MKKEVIVLSLGGSLIVPEKINYKFIHNFKRIILKNSVKNKFIIVCGGGAIARKYISIMKKEKFSKKKIALAGIKATRMNAIFMMEFFGEKKANNNLPKSIRKIKNQLRKKDIVFCGSLKYAKSETSDSTSAKLAKYFKTNLINLTNVKGLYTSDPKTHKKAKLIQKISWEKFEEKTNKIKFEAGQHFVLDQKAAKIIRKNKITTYILGQNIKNINNFLKGKKFTGTTIKKF